MPEFGKMRENILRGVQRWVKRPLTDEQHSDFYRKTHNPTVHDVENERERQKQEQQWHPGNVLQAGSSFTMGSGYNSYVDEAVVRAQEEIDKKSLKQIAEELRAQSQKKLDEQ